MEDNCKYIICNKIYGKYIAEHKTDHILYSGKQYGAHSSFMREDLEYCSTDHNF